MTREEFLIRKKLADISNQFATVNDNLEKIDGKPIKSVASISEATAKTIDQIKTLERKWGNLPKIS